MPKTLSMKSFKSQANKLIIYFVHKLKIAHWDSIPHTDFRTIKTSKPLEMRCQAIERKNFVFVGGIGLEPTASSV